MAGAPLRWLLPLLLSFCLIQCDACSGDALAELTGHEGPVEKQGGASGNPWNAADVGARFSMGDALKTGVASTAALRFFPDGALRVQPDTVIRFLDAPPDAPRRLQVESGQIEIEAVSSIDVATAGGVARVAKGSRVSVVARDDRTQILVEVGSVEALGEEERATPGQRLTLEVGSVIAEDVSAAAATAQGAQTNDDDAKEDDQDPLSEDETDDPGEGQAGMDGPHFLPSGSQADFVVDSSVVATIHDPQPPTRLGLRAPTCTGAIAVEVKQGRSAWSKAERNATAVVELSPGIYRYRARCADSPIGYATHGRLAVRHDAATRRLPTRAPVAKVEMDGRKYTVQYQNLLPTLRFVWSKAPESENYVLEQSSGGGPTRRIDADRNAVAVVRSGDLDEGTYRFRMRTAGGRSSMASTVRIAFDNNARSAYLSSPQDGSFDRNESAKVIGAALAGADVSTDSGDLHVNHSGRFEGTAQVRPGERALVVQVRHKRSGTHYYLRYPR